MPGIYLYTGNRLEVLADKFAELIHTAPLPPLHKEIIVVQSRGMARWLAMKTAAALNIWANCECPFPNTFIKNIYRQVIPEASGSSSYDREHITWNLMTLLPELLDKPSFAKVSQYLKSDPEGLKLYQLAHKTADLLDQYVLYRPEMIMSWEADTVSPPAEHIWQQHLWLHFVKRLQAGKGKSDTHRARQLRIFMEELQNPQFDRRKLPARVFLFGISSLPPYHLSILASLAHHVDLHLFIMNPCMEFWFDIIADRDIIKISRESSHDQEKLHLEHGNSLLSSMGHLGRDFLAMVQDLNCTEMDLFQDPGNRNLLSSIQQDIFFLKENYDPQLRIADKEKISPNDRSVTFQSCHSPMREVEILHDNLLEFFNHHNGISSIEPRDILVMAPDINEYVPLIHAVFDQVDSKGDKLPYSISDQSFRNTSSYIDSFLFILSLVKGRLSNIDILDLLRMEPVKKRLSFNDRDISTIERWISETGICWGIDSEHRVKNNLPPYDENTWRAGIDRLLLGYASSGSNSSTFQNILPYSPIEGSITGLLGNFIEFIESLFSLLEIIEHKHSLSEWSDILYHAKEKLLLADKSSLQDENLLNRSLLGLKDLQSQTSFTAGITIQVIQSYLSDHLEKQHANIGGTAGFLKGGITFCSMLPMRAIPFKIICLLGMDDGKYPRSGQKRSFDLMAMEPKRGDRSGRYDDRYLFLETILSARENLYISFTGQSLETGTAKPPSVLVSELMDYIALGYELDDPGKTSDDIVGHLSTLHKLQPFHPDYFNNQDEELNDYFSFSNENCSAATALMAGRTDRHPATFAGLPSPPERYKEIEINDLIRFFSHPVRYFLVRRLGLRPMEETRHLSASEPFFIKGLERYKLENNLLDRLIDKQSPDDIYQSKRAEGVLPHGRMGQIQFARILSEVQLFKNSIDTLLKHENPQNLEISLAVNDFRISGIMKNITGKGTILYRCAAISPRDIIGGWINHLIYNSMAENDRPYPDASTLLMGKDVTIKFSPLPDSRNYLAQLLDLYWHGLSVPLHFFPRTSYAFAKKIYAGKNEQEALLSAHKEWAGNAFVATAEKDDPYNSLYFKDEHPLDAIFIEQTRKLFLPVLEYQSRYTES